MVARPGLLLACLVGISVFTFGCGSSHSTVGNLKATCAANSSCSCNVVGNCEYDCPGGGCSFTCNETGNCQFTCSGGNCTTACQNVGDCNTTCTGNGCAVTCNSAAVCSLNECPAPSTCTKT